MRATRAQSTSAGRTEGTLLTHSRTAAALTHVSGVCYRMPVKRVIPYLRPCLFLVFPMAVLSLSVGCGPSVQQQKTDRKNAEYHYNLAYGNYFDSTRPNVDGAMQEVLKSLIADPDYPEAHMLAGLIYLGRKQYTQSIRHFKTALKLRPNFLKAKNNLGAAYLADGQYDAAIQVYEDLTKNIMYATPGNAHNNIGWAWYQKGDLVKARRYFLSAINLAPRLCVAYNNLGIVQSKQGQPARALKNFERAAAKCPRYAEPHYHLGRLHSDARQVEGAQQSLNKCISLAGDSLLGLRCEERLKALQGAVRGR